MTNPLKDASRRPALIAAALLAAAVVLALAFAPKPADERYAEVKSPDGLLTLRIPDGALPADVETASIAVEPRTDLPEYGPEDGERPSVYALKPDGLVLAKPARFSFVVRDAAPGAVPYVLHVSGPEESFVTETVATSVAVDEAGVMTVSGEIGHFSDLVVWKNGFFTVSSKTEKYEHKVKESFDLTLVVTPTEAVLVHWPRESIKIERKVKLGSFYTVKGKFKGGDYGIIQPRMLSFAPSENVRHLYPTEVSGTFTCAKAGYENVGAKGYYPDETLIAYEEQETTYRYWRQAGSSGAEKSETTRSQSASVYHLEKHTCVGDEPKTVPASFQPEKPKPAPVPAQPDIPKPGADGGVSIGDKKYYRVRSTMPDEDTGNEVCAKMGKTCLGYTDLTLTSCLAFHPGAQPSQDWNGSKAGFFCNGPPQGGICAQEANTCHICPQCNLNMECDTVIGDLYHETFVECK